MRLALHTINAELSRHGHNAVLAKGDGYFYFWPGEAAQWLEQNGPRPDPELADAEAVEGQVPAVKEGEPGDQAGRQARKSSK